MDEFNNLLPLTVPLASIPGIDGLVHVKYDQVQVDIYVVNKLWALLDGMGVTAGGLTEPVVVTVFQGGQYRPYSIRLNREGITYLWEQCHDYLALIANSILTRVEKQKSLEGGGTVAEEKVEPTPTSYSVAPSTAHAPAFYGDVSLEQS